MDLRWLTEIVVTVVLFTQEKTDKRRSQRFANSLPMVIHTEWSISALKTNRCEFTQKAGAAAPIEAWWYTSCFQGVSRCPPCQSDSGGWRLHSERKFIEVSFRRHRSDLFSLQTVNQSFLLVTDAVLSSFSTYICGIFFLVLVAKDRYSYYVNKRRCEWGLVCRQPPPPETPPVNTQLDSHDIFYFLQPWVSLQSESIWSPQSMHERFCMFH